MEMDNTIQSFVETPYGTLTIECSPSFYRNQPKTIEENFGSKQYTFMLDIKHPNSSRLWRIRWVIYGGTMAQGKLGGKTWAHETMIQPEGGKIQTDGSIKEYQKLDTKWSATIARMEQELEPIILNWYNSSARIMLMIQSVARELIREESKQFSNINYHLEASRSAERETMRLKEMREQIEKLTVEQVLTMEHNNNA
jgi:hypothetical protein